LKSTVAALLLAASLASTAIARANEPVPTTDQVVAIMAELTDPSKPAIDKADIVTPGFTPEEAAKIDDHLHRMDVAGLLPLPFIITNIQPPPITSQGRRCRRGDRFIRAAHPARSCWLIKMGTGC
jgi:hypothetical protein